MRPPFEKVIQDLSLLTKLGDFYPYVIGTPPLGISLETSDIDIACSANDLLHFERVAKEEFSDRQGFRCRKSVIQELDSVVVQFHALNWDIELFCQQLSTQDQWGVRHFIVERRMLNLEPKLKEIVIQLKQDGLKTEPAFAAALGLPGDPYQEILRLEYLSDSELASIIENRSF